MTKILLILFMFWLLIRLFRGPARRQERTQSRTTTRREAPRSESPCEGSTTISRITQPKEKVVNASDAELAHYEEVE